MEDEEKKKKGRKKNHLRHQSRVPLPPGVSARAFPDRRTTLSVGGTIHWTGGQDWIKDRKGELNTSISPSFYTLVCPDVSKQVHTFEQQL